MRIPFRAVLAVVACAAAAPIAYAWNGGEQRIEQVDRSSACLSATRSPRSYGWPVMPFDAPHPVRGNFGDPRMIFAEAGSDGRPSGVLTFQFHNGVDISAADGTPVYPVVSGHVISIAPDHLSVRTLDHRHFQYWHIEPLVHVGEWVTADVTVLGHVLPRQEHVHLTEIDRWTVVNPLRPGHLFPYSDGKPPRVDTVSFVDADGDELPGPRIAETVDVVAGAHDDPTLTPPGAWGRAEVIPALMRWWLTDSDGVRVLGPVTVFDFRHTLPTKRHFWEVYAEGTYQNFPTTGAVRSTLVGRYLFHVARLDTRLLENGRYELTIEAADICGNTGRLTTSLEIANG